MCKLGSRLCFIGTVICMMFFMVPVSAVSAASNDTVKVGMRYDISTVNMLEMKLGSDIPAILLMHESLIVPDPVTGDRIGGLAKSFEILENGKRIRIEMYKGATFHTGDPVTAHDVKFTYDECANPSNGNMMAGALDEIEEIEVNDDYTLIFHFWESYAPWEELMWLGICSKKYYEKVGPKKFRSHPVGSGPLRFVERKIGEHLILEAVEGYPFYVPEGYTTEPIDFKYIHIITVPDDMSRLAIRHGINRQEMVDRIFLGEGYPLYTYASRAELGHDPNVTYAYDLEKAREYLKKSAYKKGTPLTFTYTSMVPNAPLVAALVQKYLEQVGITIKLQQLEEGTAATYTRNRDKRLGHMRLYQWPGSRDPNLRLIMSVLSTSDYASVTNRPRKEEVDQLILAQAREMDKAKRADLIAQIHDIMGYDAVGALLFGLNMIYGMSDRVDYTWTPKEAYYPHLQTIKIIK